MIVSARASIGIGAMKPKSWIMSKIELQQQAIHYMLMVNESKEYIVTKKEGATSGSVLNLIRAPMIPPGMKLINVYL